MAASTRQEKTELKRIVIYIGILCALLFAPVESLNVGELIPVQVVALSKENGWTVIETDTGNRGIGGTAQKALQNLKDTASGDIYLDTAEYLLLGKDTEGTAEELRAELKPSVKLCETAKSVDLAKSAKFLRVHGKLPKLKDWNGEQELPVLSTFGDALIFLKKVENKA